MNQQHERTPGRRVPRRRLNFLLACLVAATTLGAAAPTAGADLCSACGPPTATQMAGASGFALDVRYGQLDYYEVDGGECDVTVTSTPRVRKLSSYYVRRGRGEVWNCPHSKSSDTIRAEVRQSDSSTWSLSSTLGAKIGAFGVGLEAKVVLSVGSSVTIATTTSISKTIHAAWCVRIQWEGWFEVATYIAEVDYEVKRRFAWWTKNKATGSTVHQSGNLWIPCGTGMATLDMKAPISGHFLLRQRGCSDPECAMVPTKELGYFPPLGEVPVEDEPSDEPNEEEDDDDPVPPSSELPDPPAGVPPSPPGFEPDTDTESGS